VFIKAKPDSLKALKKILQIREKIQGSRGVDDNYIWGLLEREYFLPRLSRRLQRNRTHGSWAMGVREAGKK
jgi:hypothetical protein